MNVNTALSLLAAMYAIISVGCASTGAREEKGPDGTIAYYLQVESNEVGARVEVNDDYVGDTPATVKIWGDRDGTFHNFGSSDFVIRVLPRNTNHFIQTRVFRTGGWFSQEDQIPKRLYFDVTQKQETFSIDRPRY